MAPVASADIFCEVIDNFGDAGVCFRLAKQLVSEYGLDVRLVIDDLNPLVKFAKADPSLKDQDLSGVTVVAGFSEVRYEGAPLVIEGFGCRLPDEYVSGMEKSVTAPVWINLEYLSAEDWTEGCHLMASPQSTSKLVKHFFFPGFSPKTGLLIREKGLLDARDAFVSDPEAKTAFFKSLGADVPADVLTVSLFCYRDAPVTEWLTSLSESKSPVYCFVPIGCASEKLASFFGREIKAGESAVSGRLTVFVYPMTDQDGFDRLLFACDANVVRGEDSLVRAVWAGKPFIWDIYKQAEGAHADKLTAFLDVYGSSMPPRTEETVRETFLAWNRLSKTRPGDAWERFSAKLPEINRENRRFATKTAEYGDLATGLMRFFERFAVK